VTLADSDRGIVVRPEARVVMAAYRPAVWLVLQDVALDAEWHAGRLLAATSARLIAEHLRLDPSTAAAALRVLRDAGLVQLGQATGPDGRFGLASYTVSLPDGVETLAPKPIEPRAEKPCAVNSHTVSGEVDVGLVLTCPWDGAAPTAPPGAPVDHQPRVTNETGPWSPPAVAPRSSVDEPATPAMSDAVAPRRRRGAAKPSVEQGAFDLGADL
jgi:hypothetical protein